MAYCNCTTQDLTDSHHPDFSFTGNKVQKEFDQHIHYQFSSPQDCETLFHKIIFPTGSHAYQVLTISILMSIFIYFNTHTSLFHSESE